MKDTETYYRCEYCDKMILDQSPPQKERYNNAEITIREGRVLLPDEVVKRNHKEGISDSHATGISGTYCTPQCFISMLYEILHKDYSHTKTRKRGK